MAKFGVVYGCTNKCNLKKIKTYLCIQKAVTRKGEELRKTQIRHGVRQCLYMQ